jgi:hypothetical protein
VAATQALQFEAVMAKSLARLFALLVIAVAAGCETLGKRTGVEYTLDLDKIGTGEQAIVPLNDYTQWNGPSLYPRQR